MLSKILRIGALISVPLALAGAAAAQDYGHESGQPPAGLMLFSGEQFQGDIREVFEPVYTLHDYQFNDRPRSVAVLSGAWELCEDVNFTGRCVFVRQDVEDLGWFGLNREITSVRPIYEYTEAEHGLMFVRDEDGYIRYADSYYGYDDYNYGYSSSSNLSVSIYHYGYSPHYRSYGYYDPHLGYGPYGFAWTRHGVNRNYGHYGYRRERPPLRGHYGARHGDVTLYVDANDRGPSLGLNHDIADLSRYRFNDNVSSIRIKSGVWELCEHANYGGRCQIVDASVDRLNGIRLNDNVSSIRRVDGSKGRRDRDRDHRDDGNRPPRDRDHNRGDRHDGYRSGTPGSQPDTLAGAPQAGVTSPPPVNRRIARDGEAARGPRNLRTGTGQNAVRTAPPPVQRTTRPQPVTPPAVVRQREAQPQQRREALPTPALRNRQETPRAQPPVQRPQVQQRREQLQQRPQVQERREQLQQRPQRQIQQQQAPRQQTRPVQQPRPQVQQRQQARPPVQARPQVQPRPQPAARPAPQPQRSAPPPAPKNNNNNMPKALRNRGNQNDN